MCLLSRLGRVPLVTLDVQGFVYNDVHNVLKAFSVVSTMS